MTQDQWMNEALRLLDRFEYAALGALSRYGSVQHAQERKAALTVHLQQRPLPVREGTEALFNKTYCSQCGGEFGPGDEGFSHCSDHETAPCETCHGEGSIDERLGGYSFSNPAATCPECDGTGEGPVALRSPSLPVREEPTGWKLVPVEPPRELLQAMHLMYWRDGNGEVSNHWHECSEPLWRKTYAAMLAASGVPPSFWCHEASHGKPRCGQECDACHTESTDPCDLSQPSGRTCERGTKGCTATHGVALPLAGQRQEGGE